MSEYAQEVERFAAPRLITPDGDPQNLRHETDFAHTEVVTDGVGNIVKMPLLMNKPCFARPERHIRCAFGGKRWRDDRGVTRYGKTPCDSCEQKSPGVYKACSIVASERVGSDVPTSAAFHSWFDQSETHIGHACFAGGRLPYWRAFLQAIVMHGGWASVNDDQVNVEIHRRTTAERVKRNNKAKARRDKERQARSSARREITPDFLTELEAERDRRLSHLKRIRSIAVNRDGTRWLWDMSDDTCVRVTDVWQARELINHRSMVAKGQDIAQLMHVDPRYNDTKFTTLRARVYEDLKRLAKLEDDRGGSPIWKKWTYLAPP